MTRRRHNLLFDLAAAAVIYDVVSRSPRLGVGIFLVIITLGAALLGGFCWAAASATLYRAYSVLRIGHEPDH